MTNMISTYLDAEIAKARKQASDRIAKLKRDAAAEQTKIDAKVIELLREQDTTVYERLSGEAVEILAAAKSKGSRTVRPSADTGSSAPTNLGEPGGTLGAGA
ncbi:hypothetical protein ACQR35_09690 [Pseudarthrobacter sp. J1738]|uniref:hypothetical protein n=1 Tax=Pseudarthrobacter sp. J1738 TaxID=3420446 RepID=UPI003D2AA334